MKRKTAEKFIAEAKLIHGNRYDYSKVNYINDKTKVEIICSIHGAFWQLPNAHLRGQGCPLCGINKNAKNRSLSTLQFIAKAKKVHGNRYDYSKINYISGHIKLEIGCPKHGSFFQDPYSHLNGCGCPICKSDKLAEKYSLTTQEFINLAKSKVEDSFDYSKANYINNKTKVEIICPKGHTFWITPGHLLQGGGCPICKESRGERTIRRYLESNNIIFEAQKKFNDLSDKQLLSYDFFLPEKNILIEYNGIQHYEPVKFGNYSDAEARNNLKLQRHHDWLKRKYAKEHNFKLIIIKYDEGFNLEELM